MNSLNYYLPHFICSHDRLFTKMKTIITTHGNNRDRALHCTAELGSAARPRPSRPVPTPTACPAPCPHLPAHAASYIARHIPISLETNRRSLHCTRPVNYTIYKNPNIKIIQNSNVDSLDIFLNIFITF